MRASVPLPSLSQVQNWEIDHLSQAATHWSNTADDWQNSFDRVAQQMPSPGGFSWHGEGAESAQTRATADRAKVRGASDDLRVASAIARAAVNEITAAKSKVLNAVGEAHGQGFAVGEDLTITDRLISSTATERAARVAQAQSFAADIRARALTLVATDEKFASQIASTVTGLGDLAFIESPSHRRRDSALQALDFSESPPPPEPTEPQPPRGLPPEGVSPPVAGDLTQGPASRPSEAGKGGQSLWDENGGEWRYFPGDRYHNPHWDFNPHSVPNSPWDNVPIGDLPPVKDNPIITVLPPWLADSAVPGTTGPPQSPLLAPFPGADMPAPRPFSTPPAWEPADVFPDVHIDVPNPQDLENAGAAGTGVVAGGGLLALLYMIFVQN